MNRYRSVEPLAGVLITERCGALSSEIGSVAVALAGTLAKRLGARVLRVCDVSEDPLAFCAPLLPDGKSALHRFLTDGKELIRSLTDEACQGFLLTDDEQLAAQWGRRRLLVRDAFESDGCQQSELTLAAAAGLLDIQADAGMPPLPLPGYQMAYSAGLAAFTALQACLFAEQVHGTQQDAEVSALDVAQWVNWKHQLSDISSLFETGLDRAEEWRVFPCRDGFIAAIFRDRDMPNVAQLAGMTRLAEPDFSSNKLRAKNYKELHALLAESMRDKSKAEILGEAIRLKLPYAEVCTPAQLHADPQFVERAFIQDGMPRAPIVWQSAGNGGMKT